MKTAPIQARWSPASACRGAARATTWAAITCVWARDAVEAGFRSSCGGSRPRTCSGCSAISSLPRHNRTGTGFKTLFPTGVPTGKVFQLDEAGFPVLPAAKLRESEALGDGRGVSDMVERAVRFIAQHGPPQPARPLGGKRWHQSLYPRGGGGCIGCRSRLFRGTVCGRYALSLADYWNERIESWTYVSDTPLAQQTRGSGLLGSCCTVRHERGITGGGSRSKTGAVRPSR